MKQLTKKQAIALYNSGEWQDWTDDEIVKMQLYQKRVCLPFSKFHGAMEHVLGRPIWTHEFAFPDNLVAEYEGKCSAPTFDEIVGLFKDKSIIILIN